MSRREKLIQLGITPNYIGFYQLLFALELVSREPDALLLVTKRLYPAVAKEFGTTWKAVERNIRFAVCVAWTRNPDFLSRLARYTVTEKPKTAQFLAILACSEDEKPV